MSDNKCPKCGAEVGYGYGYAYGNGIGGYQYCKNECGYFIKWPDEIQPKDDKDNKND